MPEAANAVEVADALLLAVLRLRAIAVTVAPLGDSYALVLQDGSQREVRCVLDRPLGSAVAVRLAILAGIDPWAEGSPLGRLRIRSGTLAAELMVVPGRGESGHTAELRRVAEGQASVKTSTQIGLGEPIPTHAGPYRLGELIGEGGMGVVFRAVHEPSGRAFAVKVLHPEVASDPQLARQFIQEGRAASVANGPDIVNVYDFGLLAHGRAFLVMELVEGVTLAAVLADGPLETTRALQIGRRIAAALEAIHVRGVIHRDLKPSNVFLDALDRVKIADFGIAKLMTASADFPGTLSGSVVGTPHYMAPEQALAREVDERADVYALGGILYQMITGSVPYGGRRVFDAMLRKLSDPVPLVQSPYGELPAGTEALVKRALARQPEDRFQSAGVMAGEIDRVLAGTSSAGEARD